MQKADRNGDDWRAARWHEAARRMENAKEQLVNAAAELDRLAVIEQPAPSQ